MATHRYSVTPHPIETLLTWVNSGETAIPEIQRPVVWDATKGRTALPEASGLLAATQLELEALAAHVAQPEGRPETAAEIGVRAGKIINHYKMAKHFTLTIHLSVTTIGQAHYSHFRRRKLAYSSSAIPTMIPITPQKLHGLSAAGSGRFMP
jgi:hypothetical protein